MKILKKLWKILTAEQRRASMLLLSMMLVGMFLETLGVGLVVPALALMTQSDLINKYPDMVLILDVIGNPSRESLVIIGMSVLVAVYGIKTCFLAFLAWKQTGFVYRLQASLSQRLYSGYLRQPYGFHLQRNSAQLIRNATTEVSMLATVTQSVLMVISEGMVLIGISILLMIVEPVGAILVITTLGIAGLGFYRFTRKRISLWGKARQYHEGFRIQHLQQGLGGVKDVKLMGREEDFFNQYAYHTNQGAHVSHRQAVFQQFPRLWLELLAVSGLGALVFAMIIQGKPIDALLPTLGLFAAAAFRIMPSVNRVLIALQSFRYAVPVIDTLYQEVVGFVDESHQPTGHLKGFNKEIEITGVSYRYQDAERNALEGINIMIPRGTCVGFIGESGSGKSTLVDVVLGLLTPNRGSVKVDGKDVQQYMRSWQDNIGYVPQTIYLTDDTLRRNIAFGLSEDQIDDSAVYHAVRMAQLDHFVSELSDGLDTVVGERGVRLSGGQRQRIGIARALYHDPDVLVLDEATSALDTATEYSVMESVHALQGKKTVLIIAHRLSTVERCNTLYRLERGHVVEAGDAAMMLSGKKKVELNKV